MRFEVVFDADARPELNAAFAGLAAAEKFFTAAQDERFVRAHGFTEIALWEHRPHRPAVCLERAILYV
jgi:hypothetical protein